VEGNPRLAPPIDPVARGARTASLGRKIDLEIMTHSLICLSRLHEFGSNLLSLHTTWMISPSHPRNGRLGFFELGLCLLEACDSLVTPFSPVVEPLGLRRVRSRRLEGSRTGLFWPDCEDAWYRWYGRRGSKF
jgi:hypothetical protein